MNHLSTPQTAHSEPVRQEHTRLSGFDWLRLFAIILVTYQHTCTLLRLDTWTKLYRIDVGQLGVCIFLALSAILATQDKRPPWQWLWRRFVKIMPAYWIVMLVSFLLAWLSGHKSFDIWQFISQMLGTGLFTHPHNLVNSPTWFVSLLLALYLYTFLFRFILPNSLQATVLAITYISYASLYYKQLIVYDHISTYIICVVICLLFQQRNMQFALLLSGASLMLLSWCGVRPLNHCAGSLLLVGLFWHFPAISNIVRMLIEYSYEYYLVHGIFLKLTIQYSRLPAFLAVCLAVLLSAASAVVLNRLVGVMLKQARFINWGADKKLSNQLLH